MSFGLYVHIPFCVRKCAYCDFLSFPSDAEIRQAYADTLIREIGFWGEALGRPAVTSVFFGGGTPTVLEAHLLRAVFESIGKAFDVREKAEISIEMNPGTDRPELDDIMLNYVNRVSIGLQSMDSTELRELGRIHTAEDFLKTFSHLRSLGVSNINVDLMSALPGQTKESYERTLKEVTALEPEHISAYSLIVEEGTPFYDRYEIGELSLPDEETEREMDKMTGEILSQAGYHRYEISNYARDGYECRHNRLYWTGEPYLGVGLGASSLIGGCRFSNTPDLKTYIALTNGLKEADGRQNRSLSDVPWITGFHELTVREQMEETLFLGLRLTEGISGASFKERFGRTLDDVYGDVIRRHIEDGLIVRTEHGIALTARGRDISNTVLADYLLD